MNDIDVFQELLNEVRGLREAVERGPDTHRPLTLKEAAAAYLQIHEDTLYRWACEGRLAYSRPGDAKRASLRFLEQDLDRFNDPWRVPAVEKVTCRP